jgi:hypothetical protein
MLRIVFAVAIAVDPTLEMMADVYRRSLSGGPQSARFRSYVDVAKAMAPVQGYNPMTSKPVLATIEALIVAHAEARVETLANQTALRLGYDRDDVMHVTVATPGMWTDRLATEVEHRLLAKDPGGVLWWFDQTVETDALDFEIVAQTVRLTCQRRAGAPESLNAAARQEGLAGMIGGRRGAFHPDAAEVLAVLADDTSLATMVAFLYGDTAAAEMGFGSLGLEGRTGYEHAVALAATQGGSASTQ